MTIAACYLSPEGVVLGADSTSTYGTPGAPHFYNHSQKLFEIGEESTVGVVCWGLGGLQVRSHRTLFALLADDLKASPPASVLDVADRWIAMFWAAYIDPSCPIAPYISQCRTLHAKPAFDPKAAQPDPTARTEAEEREYGEIRGALIAGFCIAGYVGPTREPVAFEIIVDCCVQGPPTATAKPLGYWFWGAPNMIQRLIFAADDGLKNDILSSGKWTGTAADLDGLVSRHVLQHPYVPIRDAIDFVHACIHSTIKAFKFSSLAQICGGPIEIAVITTDRRFRWVRHKPWDAAVLDGGS